MLNSRSVLTEIPSIGKTKQSLTGEEIKYKILGTQEEGPTGHGTHYYSYQPDLTKGKERIVEPHMQIMMVSLTKEKMGQTVSLGPYPCVIHPTEKKLARIFLRRRTDERGTVGFSFSEGRTVDEQGQPSDALDAVQNRYFKLKKNKNQNTIIPKLMQDGIEYEIVERTEITCEDKYVYCVRGENGLEKQVPPDRKIVILKIGKAKHKCVEEPDQGNKFVRICLSESFNELETISNQLDARTKAAEKAFNFRKRKNERQESQEIERCNRMKRPKTSDHSIQTIQNNEMSFIERSPGNHSIFVSANSLNFSNPANQRPLLNIPLVTYNAYLSNNALASSSSYITVGTELKIPKELNLEELNDSHSIPFSFHPGKG